MRATDFDEATRTLSAEEFRQFIAAPPATIDRLSRQSEVGGPRVVVAASGSDVSAADGAVVIAEPGSRVTAWSGARVFAVGGAQILLGSGSGCHVDGSSRVVADGERGIEFYLSSAIVVSARGGAQVELQLAQAYLADVTATVGYGVLAAVIGPAQIVQGEARGSTIRNAEAAFADILDDIRETAARHTASRPRTVWPARPREGQSREEWLAPLRRMTRRRGLKIGPRILDGEQRAMVAGRALSTIAIPPTILGRDLDLS